MVDKDRKELIRKVEEYFRVTEIPKDLKATKYAPMVKAAILAILKE